MLERFYLLFFLFFLFSFFTTDSFSQNIQPDRKPKVILFFSLECPICQKYVPEINHIFQEYSSRVHFEVVIPERPKAKLIRKFSSDYKVKFPLDIDRDGLTRSLNPEVTPEVFLFNESGELVYQGAIDNWFYELGKYRTRPTEIYLRNALESVLSGTMPKITKTKSIGCIISAHGSH